MAVPVVPEDAKAVRFVRIDRKNNAFVGYGYYRMLSKRPSAEIRRVLTIADLFGDAPAEPDYIIDIIGEGTDILETIPTTREALRYFYSRWKMRVERGGE